jgi:hypothetical protein
MSAYPIHIPRTSHIPQVDLAAPLGCRLAPKQEETVAEEDSDMPSRSWSSTFVRNRTEVFAIAFLIFAITWFDLKSSQVASISLEFGHPASKGVLYFFLFMLFLYFLICWGLRWRIEYRETTLPIRMLSKLNSELRQIANSIPAYHNPNLSEAFDGFIEGRWGQLIDSLQSVIPYFIPQTQFEQIRTIEQKITATLADRASAPSELNDVAHNLRKIVEGHEQFRNEIDALLKRKEEGFAEVRRTTEAQLRSLALSEHKKIDAHSSSIKDHMLVTENMIGKIERKEKELITLLGAEKNIFGFIVPLITAMFLCGVSIPYALAPMKESFQAIVNCKGSLPICLHPATTSGR